MYNHDIKYEFRMIWYAIIFILFSVMSLSVILLINTLSDRTKPENLVRAENAPVSVQTVEVEDLSIEDYIRQQAKENGIDPDLAVLIGKCESSLNPNAKHLISSATGIFQFTSGTWKWIKAEGERTDYKASTREFVKWFPIYPDWWSQCLP